MSTIILKQEEVVPYILEKEKNGMELKERVDGDLHWYGTTLENALERAQKGCKSCSGLISETIIPIVRKQSNWGIGYNMLSDYQGPNIDPGYLSLGIPECAIIPEAIKQHTLGEEGLDIIVNCIVSSFVSTEVIRARGILACTIALIAERMELSTRIVVGYTVGYSEPFLSDFAVIIKDYARPIDLPLLAFYLISPASPRRIGFSLFDVNDKNSRKNGHYYAANTKYKVERKKQIVIDHGHIRSELLEPESAIRAALHLLRENGVIK